MSKNTVENILTNEGTKKNGIGIMKKYKAKQTYVDIENKSEDTIENTEEVNEVESIIEEKKVLDLPEVVETEKTKTVDTVDTKEVFLKTKMTTIGLDKYTKAKMDAIQDTLNLLTKSELVELLIENFSEIFSEEQKVAFNIHFKANITKEYGKTKK